MKIWLRSLLALSVMAANQTAADAQFRKYSNEFLNIGAGARGLGMGSAQVASVGDYTAGYWNPAALTRVRQAPEVGFMHAEYFSGIGKYDYLAAAIPLKDGKRTLGISALRFAVDDIPNTLFLVEPDGSLNYGNIRSFSSADYAFLLSYGHVLRRTDDEELSVGGNAKIIYRQVGSFAKAWGFGFDLSTIYRRKDWFFGATLRDASSTFNAWTFSFTDREKEALYLTKNDIPVKSQELTAPRLALGAARRFRFSDKFSLLAEANADLTFDGQRNTLLRSSAVSLDPKLGLEANYQNTVFLRAGVSNFQQGLSDGDTTNQKKVWIFQPSIGAGFKAGNLRIDYAFTNLANQDFPLYTHIFSLHIALRKKEK